MTNTTIPDDTNQQQEAAAPLPRKRSAAAERMARHRARRRDGMRCITLDLREAVIERLVELGHLRQEDREDQNEILLALYRFLDQSELCPSDLDRLLTAGRLPPHHVRVHCGTAVDRYRGPAPFRPLGWTGKPISKGFSGAQPSLVIGRKGNPAMPISRHRIIGRSGIRHSAAQALIG